MSSLQKVRRPIAHSQKSTYVWISFLSKPWNPHLSYLFMFFSLLTFPTFFKNQDPSLVLFYDSLTLCKKSEKTDELIQRSCVANNRSSHRRCFVKKKVFLEISQNSKENKYATSVFLWILRNYQEHLFYEIPPGDCFWNKRTDGPKNSRTETSPYDTSASAGVQKL